MLYVDGEPDSLTKIAPQEIHITIVSNVLIGAPCDASNRFFEGLIDDVRIYERALSDIEIYDMSRGALLTTIDSGNLK